MKYLQFSCEVLDNAGDYDVKVGVLYHAEAEWSCKDYDTCDNVCKVLTQNQIDFDIVPLEYLKSKKYSLFINGYRRV